jgi:hypothetical protein
MDSSHTPLKHEKEDDKSSSVNLVIFDTGGDNFSSVDLKIFDTEDSNVLTQMIVATILKK